jgi:DNA modification methylase
MGDPWRGQYELCFVFADSRAPLVNNVQLGRFGRTRTNVWSWPGAASLRKELLLHPTPKPVGLLAEAIRDVTNRGDIVLDCFSGSGSTIIAAAKTGRRCYAIELDPHYVEVAIKRWENWSGQKARHAETGLTLEELRVERNKSASKSEPAATPLPAVRHRSRPQ